MSGSESIQFLCPRCDHSVKVAGTSGGGQVLCPGCQQLVPVPDQSPSMVEGVPAEAEADEILPTLDELQHSSLPTVGEDDLISDDPLPESQSEQVTDSTNDSTDGETASISELLNEVANEKAKTEAKAIPIKEMFGVVCRVCDTRIHVRPDQVGTQVECPICYSPVQVDAPRNQKRRRPLQTTMELSEVTKLSDDGELTLEPIQEESAELAPLEPPSLEPESAPDLLRPRGNSRRDLTLEPSANERESAVGEPPETASADELTEDDGELKLEPLEAAPSKASQRPSSELMEFGDLTLEPLEEADPEPAPRRQTPRSATPGHTAKRRSDGSGVGETLGSGVTAPAEKRPGTTRTGRGDGSSSKRETSPAPSQPASPQGLFPDEELGIPTALYQMLSDPAVVWRVALSTVVMLLGVVLAESIFPVGMESPGDEFFAAAIRFLLWLAFGMVPYFLGAMFLWWICGYLFREAAEGKERVESWSVAGRDDLLGTFSLFSFSFLVAGLPALLMFGQAMPIRMLLAPLFLASAWMNRSPFQIISADTFQWTDRVAPLWGKLYPWMIGLAVGGLVSGRLFAVRWWTEIWLVDVLVASLAVILNVGLTLVFATLNGWHVGKLVRELEAS